MSLDASTLFTSLLPDTIDSMTATILIIAAAFTSMLTAALGAGGGVMLLAALALTLPPAAIIPVHGLVQMGSNVNRAIMTWRHIHWQTILWFLPGVILGAWLASLFLMQLSLETLQLTIAGFIFFLCWGPKLPKMALSRPGILIASLITSFAAMFAGASGPLVAAFIKQQGGDRFRTVATFAASMSLQHAPKALVYGVAGFVFTQWIGLIILMIIAGFIGTWAGLHLLKRIDDQRFNQLFKWMLTLLGLRLCWQAWVNF
ncbi:sulfite exporter TauE/SafE family protein [Terasakiispira papahanaumokuakeensis]|nr:sulfite exporter TauE/SafE family protein [Terasakiispira papahanaumokuakeensis]